MIDFASTSAATSTERRVEVCGMFFFDRLCRRSPAGLPAVHEGKTGSGRNWGAPVRLLVPEAPSNWTKSKGLGAQETCGEVAWVL